MVRMSPRGKKHPTREMWKCNDQDCTFTASKALMLGKKSMCGVCTVREITLTPENMRRKVPRCINCSETVQAKKIDQTKRSLAELGIL